MKIKPTNAHKYFGVSYKHSKPTTCTCFGHNCSHPHTKDKLQKLLRTNAQM